MQFAFLFAFSHASRVLMSMHYAADFALYDPRRYADPYYIKYDNVSSIARQIYNGGLKEHLFNLKLIDRPTVTALDPKIELAANKIMFRLQSAEYHEGLHLDCYGQEIRQLQGRKQWILFNLQFDDYDFERTLVHTSNSSVSLRPLARRLRRMGINYTLQTLGPGDEICVPPMTWHKTRGIGGSPQMMSNAIHYTLQGAMSRSCNVRFNRVNPVHAVACQKNFCKY